MNILAGRFKGIKIDTLPGLHFRPTTSLIRKSVFDILGNLENCSVLDLFAGSGILGFEAASRGAIQVTFVDNDNGLIKQINQNINKFADVDFRVFKIDVFSYLKTGGHFDIIFADPPYRQVDVNKLSVIVRSHLVNNGRFILESALDDAVGSGFYREKTYGGTRITFWESD